MWFRPGALIVIRGAGHLQEIEVFDGGRMILMAHFMHQSVCKIIGLKLKSSGIDWNWVTVKAKAKRTSTAAAAQPKPKRSVFGFPRGFSLRCCTPVCN